MTSSPPPDRGWRRWVRQALRHHEGERTQPEAKPNQASGTKTVDPASDDFLLGHLALQRKYVTPEHLDQALREQEAARERGSELLLGKLLAEKGWISAEHLSELLRIQAGRGGRLPEFTRYEIRERVGEGATAVIYRAWDRELGRFVALKVLRESSSLSEVARERFRREAKAAAGLSDPHVVTVFDAGEEHGQLFLVMELIEGRPLSEVLASGGNTPEQLLSLVERAARGVAAAHAHGIVHRDLKPANILVTAQGEPKVGDFGLAHLMDTPATLTRTGTTLGTPLYMAPEQVEGRSRDISPRTDVYALGAILYEAVLGRPPFAAEIVSQLYKQIVEGDVPPPRRINARVSRTLEIIIQKALSKTPARRYPTALELAEDLRRYREGEPIEAQPPSIVSHLLLRVRRNRHVLIPAFILASAAVTILGIQHFEAKRTAREQETALQAIRNQARLSLDAALRLRRAGDLRGVRALLPPLEAAYREAVTRAPGLAEVDYLMGRMHRALIENQKALEFQNRAIQKDPNYAPALYERIVLLSKMWGTFNAARGAEGGLENVFEIPEDLRQGILRDSVTLEGVLKKGSPDRSSIGQANLQVALGILALHRGSFPQAKGYFQSAIDQDPYLEEAWENLARLQENEKGAIKHVEVLRNVSETLTRAISHDQGYLPYWEELSYVKAWEAVTRHNAGEDPLPMFAEAEKCTDRILTLDPESISGLTRRGAIHFQRAVYLSQRGRDSSAEFDAAERDYQTAIRLDPQSGLAILGRIQTRVFRMIERVKSGIDPAADARAAEEDLARIRANEKTRKEVDLWQGVIETERAIYNRFQGQDPSEHLAAGERVLSEGIRNFPANTSLWLWRGILRYEQGLNRAAQGKDPLGEYSRALQDFDERIKLSGAWPEVWSRRGLALLQAGLYKASLGRDPLPDYLKAEQDFSRALARDKGHGEAWSGQGQVKLRQALWNDRGSASPRDLEGYRSAVSDLEQALKLNPTLDREIGKILAEARKKVEAVRNP